jgi:hypothetical protein
MGQAMAVVYRAHPGFHATTVNADHGVYEIGDVYGVDPGSGRITGRADLDGGLMGFVVNLHACGLTFTPAKVAAGTPVTSPDTAVAAAVGVSGGRVTHPTMPASADPYPRPATIIPSRRPTHEPAIA